MRSQATGVPYPAQGASAAGDEHRKHRTSTGAKAPSMTAPNRTDGAQQARRRRVRSRTGRPAARWVPPPRPPRGTARSRAQFPNLSSSRAHAFRGTYKGLYVRQGWKDAVHRSKQSCSGSETQTKPGLRNRGLNPLHLGLNPCIQNAKTPKSVQKRLYTLSNPDTPIGSQKPLGGGTDESIFCETEW